MIGRFSLCLLPIVLVFLFCSALNGQPVSNADDIPLENYLPSNIQFEGVTSKDGLSNNRIFSMLQDSRGFMWFGTGEGLNRYDGYTFKVYLHDPEDSLSISSNFVWFDGLVEDSAGYIWVGTKGAGLNKFDRVKETFSHYRYDPDDAFSLSNDLVTCLLIDYNGELWVGTDEGLNRFDGETEKFLRYQNDPDDATTVRHNRIRSMTESGVGSEKTLWIGTQQGLDKFERISESFTHAVYDTFTNNVNRPGPVTHLYYGQNDILWIGSGYGLFSMNLSTGELTPYLHEFGNRNSLTFSQVRDIRLEPGANGEILWVGAAWGLNRIHLPSKTYEHHLYDPEEPRGINSSNAEKIYQDSNERLWFGTVQKGFNKMKRSPFKIIRQKKNQENTLSGNAVRVIHEDQRGNIWIGTNAGFDQFDRKTGKFKRQYLIYNKPENRHFREPISGIAEDKSGRLWLSVLNRGLVRFDPSNREVLNFQHDSNDPNSVSDKQLGRLVIDSSNILWVGSLYNNISRMDLDDAQLGHFTHNRPEPDKPAAKKSMRGFALELDSYGALWVGCHLKGLYRMDLESEQYEHFPHDKDNPESVNSNSINVIYQYQYNGDTTIWIGTNSGLCRFEREKQVFTRFYNNGKDASNDIYAIVQDRRGHLWMQQKRGVSKFDVKTETFTNFGPAAGVPDDMLSTYAAYAARNGEIFFGGYYGLMFFHPDSVDINRNIPPIVLTDFQEFSQPTTLDSSITEKTHIPLNYDRNFFSFEFAALDYASPRDNQYAYQLEGLDKDWIYSGNRRRASYTDVQPGDYVFRVKGANNDGIWNEVGTSIRVTVSPPWWKTWWAYSFYVLMTIAALFYVRKYELDRQGLKQKVKFDQLELERMAEVDQMKSRFFANISHEFRTPLTLILGPLGKWLNAIDDPEMQSDFKIVQRNARRLKRLVNDLLELAKMETGKMTLDLQPEKIVELIRTLTMTFESHAKQKEIQLTFRSNIEEILGNFDRDKIEIIVTNLVSNALKFSKEGDSVKTIVNITSVDGEKINNDLKANLNQLLEIKVSDTGIGIPADQIEDVFKRYHQLEEGARVGGTGLGLALSKELIEIHNGRISAKSEVGKGTTFTVQIPFEIGELPPEGSLAEQSNAVENRKVVEPETLLLSAEDKSRPGDSERKMEKVLIVEDSPDMQNYLRNSLNKHYEIIEAFDGKKGFEQARKHELALIISDVMMPEMDGFELCEKLKSDIHTSHIPVILLTARANAESKIAGLELGADDYLTKPFNVDELQVRVKNLIAQREKLKALFRQKFIVKPAEITVTSMDAAFLDKAIAAVNKHMADAKFDTEILASECGVSRRQLNRKLRGITGQSSGEFIRIFRLKRAAELLRKQSGTVTEIAYDVGYLSIANFAKAFKKEFGVTPSEYKRNPPS